MSNGSLACVITQREAPSSWSDSDNLVDLEHWIVENVREISRCRLSICLAFARIKMNELYRQAGIDSFHGYLQVRRLKIHYHTAHDYALIGEVYLKHRDELKMIHFTENDGLRKLLLLEQGLQRAKGREAAVFKMLKDSSFRGFKRFVQAECQSGRPDSAPRNSSSPTRSNVMLSDECLVLMPDGRELLWFDPELDEFFESTELLHRFQRCIIHAVEDFFSPYFSYTPNNERSSNKAGF